MPKSLVCLVLLSVTIAATALYDSGKALATEAEGYESTSLAVGHFREIEVTSTLPRGQKAAGTSQPGSHGKRQRDCQTSMCRAIPGRLAEALAGTCTPGIA
jgi:hypothetical protein